MKRYLTAWWLPWVILGIVVRIILSIITLHPDIFALSIVPTFFAFHGVFNVYHYMGTLTPQNSLFAKNISTVDVFIYPPLAYYTLGIFTFIFRPFTDASFYNVVISQLDKTLGDPRLFQYLFFAKLPYIFFDMGSLYYITKIFTNLKQKKLAFFLWLFNPVSLYASYMIGNFDIIPVFFTVAGTYFLCKKQYAWGFLLYGLGAAYKSYPILIALPLVFYFGDTIIAKIKYFIYLVGPFVITSLPFLTTSEYRRDVLFNPKNTKFLYMVLPVTGSEAVYVFIVGVVLIIFAAMYKKRVLEISWVYPLAILLLFYSVTSYHPQWFLWITPYLVLLFTLYKWARWPIMWLLGLYVCVIFFFEASLNIGIFGPIFPQTTHLLSITDILTKHFIPDQVNQWKSLIRSVFAGISLWMIVYLLLGQDFASKTSDEKTI